MRVAGTLLFASALHVTSIVCTSPPIPNPDPPYRVVRMGASDLHDLHMICNVEGLGHPEGYVEYCPVRTSLDAVMKDDTIIGYVSRDDDISPFYNKSGSIYQKLKLGGHPQDVNSVEAGQLGILGTLPENTIYEEPAKKGAPPPNRVVKYEDKEGKVNETKVLPWRPRRVALLQSPDGRWELQPQ